MAHILIIEDTEELREMMTTLVQRMGHEVSVAQDGLEGVRAAKTSRPDLIILDLMMPVASGDLTLGYLRSTDTFKHVPVIVVSAHPSAKAIADKLQAHCIEKPFGFPELKALIDRLLSESEEMKPKDQ
ncbi:MAG TPA: response regulator [Aggregatilineales bacterium]|nr:response regulator transcription factor [Anaerolineales bacterium]HRE47329.1 response regulator [Aggregatilineales bacterium]